MTKGLFLPVSLILVLQTGASHMLSIPERDIPIPMLRQLPVEIGNWNAGAEQKMERTVEEYLKPDDYIMRDYVNEAAHSSINLFVAHFKSLQDSYGPHSPSVCLPGSGWLTRSSAIITLSLPGSSSPISVNRYEYERGGQRILVIYWYQNSRRVWADEVQSKLTFLPDLIKYRRSDVSLVRLIATIPGAGSSIEGENCLEFARLMQPRLTKLLAATN